MKSIEEHNMIYHPKQFLQILNKARRKNNSNAKKNNCTNNIKIHTKTKEQKFVNQRYNKTSNFSWPIFS